MSVVDNGELQVPRFRLVIALFIGGIAAFRVATGAADEAGSPSPNEKTPPAGVQRDHDKAKQLFESIWLAGDEIRSGVARVHEEMKAKDGAETHDYRYAFDHATDQVRFDATFNGRSTQVIRNEEETLIFASNAGLDGLVVRHPRDYEIPESEARPIDFRWVAMSALGVYRNNFPPEKIRSIYDDVVKRGSATLEVDGDITKLTWHYPVSDLSEGVLIIHLDRMKGLRPVLLEEKYRKKGEQDPEDGWYVESRTSTEWEKHGETWVPVSCKMSADRIGMTTELKLKWEAVNEDVPSEVFELKGLGVSDEAVVLNAKLGELVSEGKVGEGKLAEELSRSASAGKRWTTVLVGSNLAIFGFLLVAAAYRKMRSRKMRRSAAHDVRSLSNVERQ